MTKAPKITTKAKNKLTLILEVNDDLRKQLEGVEDFVDVHIIVYAANATNLSLYNQNININIEKTGHISNYDTCLEN